MIKKILIYVAVLFTYSCSKKQEINYYPIFDNFLTTSHIFQTLHEFGEKQIQNENISIRIVISENDHLKNNLQEIYKISLSNNDSINFYYKNNRSNISKSKKASLSDKITSKLDEIIISLNELQKNTNSKNCEYCKHLTGGKTVFIEFLIDGKYQYYYKTITNNNISSLDNKYQKEISSIQALTEKILNLIVVNVKA